MGNQNPAGNGDAEPVIVKKYANRRLYDTVESTYVTLADLANMAREGREFVVHDARTGKDITRSILVQIILESETKGENLLPLGFLRRIASLYGDTLQWAVPSYLESSMEVFHRNQEVLREQMETALGRSPAVAGLERLTRANREFFERTMRMFVPLNANEGAAKAERDGAGNGKTGADELEELRAQIAAMQGRLDEIANRT